MKMYVLLLLSLTARGFLPGHFVVGTSVHVTPLVTTLKDDKRRQVSHSWKDVCKRISYWPDLIVVSEAYYLII